MSYFIDLKDASNQPVPCTFKASSEAGKTLTIDERGRSMVVEPDGSQTRWIEPTDPAFDSEWTRGTVLSGFIVYRSSNPQTAGTPHAYRMIV